MSLFPYLLGGALMWFLMLKSGVHATIAGVMLAFAIPFSGKDDDEKSPSHKLEHFLHKPVAFIILPIFALANTAIVVGADWMQDLTSTNSVGISAGLILGKPLGVTLLCFVAVASGICRLPPDLNWRHFAGAGFSAASDSRCRFSLPISLLSAMRETTNASKMAILLASVTAGAIGYLWLALLGKPKSSRPA